MYSFIYNRRANCFTWCWGIVRFQVNSSQSRLIFLCSYSLLLKRSAITIKKL
ncbi:hypothetical protein Hanom_Chr10g00882481 [Helianthus anomalus]